MSVKINLTERFNEYVAENIKSDITELLNVSVEYLLEIEEISDAVVSFLEKDSDFLKLLSQKIGDIEDGYEEEVIKDLIKEQEDWLIQYIEEKWSNFIETQDIDNLANAFWNQNPDYGHFLWDDFIESEFGFYESDEPLFFEGKYLISVPPIETNGTKEILEIFSFIEYLKTDEDINRFLEDINEFDIEYDFLDKLTIKVDFEVNSEYYDEYLNIEVKISYYDGFNEYSYDNDSEFIEDAFGSEELWEKMIEEGGWSEDEIKENLEYIFEKTKKLVEKIEEFYEDLLNNNYYNNPKYKLEHSFKHIQNKLISSIKDLIENREDVEFFKKVVDKPYNNINPFFNGHLSKIKHKLYILRKYKELFTKEEYKNIETLAKEFIDHREDFKLDIELPEYKNGKIDNMWEEQLLIEDERESMVYGVRYFLEDKDNLFKVYNKRIEEYEEIYKKFIEIINNGHIPKIISLLKDTNVKESLAYINSRLFEDYFSKDENMNSYFENDFFKENLIKGAYLLSSLYPTEFVVFLISETFHEIQKTKTYPFVYNTNNEEKYKKEMLKEFKKIADKEEVKKSVKKALALYPYSKDDEEYKGLLYFENEFIRPVSLSKNPLEEKANVFVAREFFKLKIKEMEKKDTEKMHSNLKTPNF